VMPDLLHVVPVGDNAVLDGVLQSENTTLRLGLVTEAALSFSSPNNLIETYPTYESFWPIPTITPWCLGRPTIEGKTARGASSPATAETK
jgi:hypothetical protein